MDNSSKLVESNSFHANPIIDDNDNNNNNNKDKNETKSNVKRDSPSQVTILKPTDTHESSSDNLRSNQGSSLTESDLRTTSSNTVTVSFTESESTSRTSSHDDDDDSVSRSNSEDTSSTDSDNNDEDFDKSNQIADFSGQGFNIVPSIIFHRITITKLNLSNNSLNFLPSEICTMINLCYLDISHNNLRGYTQVPDISPEGIIQMKDGSDIIHRNSKSTDRKKVIEQFSNNNNNEISECTQLPKDMIRLTKLKTLKMSSCELKFIPKVVFQLISLTKLDISENWTNELSPLIGNLVELRYLLAKRMGLSTLPIQIINCCKLHTINVYGNEIISLPDEFSRLYRLKTLYLDCRHFMKALIKPKKLSKVKMVNFIDTFNETGQSIITSEMNKSKTSNVSEDTLNSIAERIDTLLRSGQMKSYHIPTVIFKLRRIKALYLDHCQLNFIPENLTHMKRISELYLSKNYFKEIPQGLYSIGNTLQYLDLSYNQLNMLNEESVTLPKNFGVKFTVLKVLKLASMNLTKIQNGSLCGMIQLKLLDLNYNKISQLPDDINCLISLEELYLCENKLTILPNTISQLEQLNTLDLSYNQMNNLPDDLYKLKNLKLAHIYKDFNKYGLWLQGNPLNCLAQNLWKTTDTRNLWKFLENQQMRKLSNIQPRKIIVIGHRFSGKSTLIKRLIAESSKNGNTQVGLISQMNESLSFSESIMKNVVNPVELPLGWSPILINQCISPNGFNIIFYEITIPTACSQDHIHSLVCYQDTGLELILPHILDTNCYYILVFNANLMINMNESNFTSKLWSYILTIRMYAPGSMIKLIGTHTDQIDCSNNNNNIKSIEQISINSDNFIIEQNYSQYNENFENKLSFNSIFQKYIFNQISLHLKNFQFFNFSNLYNFQNDNIVTIFENISLINLSINNLKKTRCKTLESYSIINSGINELWNEIEHRIISINQLFIIENYFNIKSWQSLIIYIQNNLKSFFMIKLDLQSNYSLNKNINNQLVLNKILFNQLGIDNIENCLKYYHIIDNNNENNKQLQYNKWYLSSLSGYSYKTLINYFNTWNLHKSFPYQMIKCLLPPITYSIHHQLNQINNNEQLKQYTNKQYIGKQRQVYKSPIKSMNQLKSSKIILKQIEGIKDNFDISISSICPSNISTNSVLLLTDLLEVGFKTNDLFTINNNLNNIQLNHLKPFIIYPCLFYNNNLMKISYNNNLLHSINSKLQNNNDNNNINEYILEIWFPLGKPMGYFNRLVVCLFKSICDEINWREFNVSMPPLKYTEKIILNNSMTKHNTFIIEHNYFDIILEELTVNGNMFALTEYNNILYGIRCIQLCKQPYSLYDNKQLEEIPFNSLIWFIESCNQLNNEIQGLYWFWSK
ncbi:unnamed protein product [Heterobilharzia americana]|nr:unnamed protein product [Heterobilharzia americana]